MVNKWNSLYLNIVQPKGQEGSGSTYFLQLQLNCEDSQFQIQSPGLEEHGRCFPTALNLHTFHPGDTVKCARE